MASVTISSCHDYSDNCFLFTSTLADAMCSMDVSRSLDLLTSYSHFPYHVPPVRVLVHSRSRFTCFPYCTDMDCRLVPGYLFVFRFPVCLIDLYAYVCRLRVSSFVLSTRLYAYHYRLCLSFCSLSTRLPSRYFWTLTHY